MKNLFHFLKKVLDILKQVCYNINELKERKKIKMKILFVIVILIWGFVGFLGIMNCKAERPNYEMMIFMFSFPFVPFVAHFCGLI